MMSSQVAGNVDGEGGDTFFDDTESSITSVSQADAGTLQAQFTYDINV